MRLLHVCPGNLYGGIERMLVTFARHRTAAPDLEQQYCLCYAGKFDDELRDAKVEIHKIGAPRFSRPWSIWAARRAFATLLHEVNPDVVACHGAWPYAIFGPIARRLGAAKLLFWLHDPPRDDVRLPWLDRLASRLQPDFVVANSSYTNERVDRLFSSRVRCAIIRPPVELPAIDDDARAGLRLDVRRKRIADDHVLILQVGRWERHKGHLLLLEALAGLTDVPTWRCWQVGAPQRDFEQRYFEEVKRAAERLDLTSRVEFLGWAPSVNELYAAADIYCQPNVGPEPFGIALVEAMGSGLPVVASASGGPMEILQSTSADPDNAGVLVTPGDVTTLREALRTLITDSAVRAAFATAGRRRAAALCDPASRVRELRGVIRTITS